MEERKSLTLEKANIKSTYMKDFVRGYFDGDGCVSIYWRKDEKKPRKILEVSILGTSQFLHWITSEIEMQIGIKKPKIQNTSSKIKKIRYSGKSALSLAEWMYSGEDLFLTRKKGVFESFKKDIGSH